MQSCRLPRSYNAWSRKRRRSSPAACARCCAPDAGQAGQAPGAGPPVCHGASCMLHNIHVLPGPAVDIVLYHHFLMTVAGYPLHPGFEHAEKHPPDHGHIANVLLQDLFSLPVDLETFVPIEFGTSLFQQGVELGVGPCLTPATSKFGIEGIVVFVVRVWIVGKPADENKLQIELPEPLTEHALFENFELGVQV